MLSHWFKGCGALVAVSLVATSLLAIAAYAQQPQPQAWPPVQERRQARLDRIRFARALRDSLPRSIAARAAIRRAPNRRAL